MDEKLKNIWVEKYRPGSLAGMILPNEYKQYFRNIIESSEARNLILFSPKAGTGKTSMAKVLVKELGANQLFINASIANMDTLKSDIANFAAYSSNRVISKKIQPKVVILDEADGLSSKLQDSLRSFIEDNVKNCRFIMTCNTIEKIIEPLRTGRTIPIDFNFAKPEYRDELVEQMLDRCRLILGAENVKYTEAGIKAIVERYYPSMRIVIATLQRHYEMYGEIREDKMMAETDAIIHFLKSKKPDDAYKYFCSNLLDPAAVIETLSDNFVDFLPKVEARHKAIDIISQFEFMLQSSQVPKVQIRNCLIYLSNLV